MSALFTCSPVSHSNDAHSHPRLLAVATLASHSIRTPGLPVIQVVAHSHPRLLAVATLARHSIRTGGLPIIQVVAPMLPVVLVMLTLTLAFLLPPWPSEAHTSASSHSSYVHSHLTSQSFKRCSLRPSPSCCGHPGRAQRQHACPGKGAVIRSGRPPRAICFLKCSAIGTHWRGSQRISQGVK